MTHALIGYAGSTVRAAEMYHETFPDEDMTVLVDYFAREVTDSLAVCRRFRDLAEAGRLAVRIDTPGSRFVEGLDPPASYAVLERQVPEVIRGYRSESELRYLVGAGANFGLRSAAGNCYRLICLAKSASDRTVRRTGEHRRVAPLRCPVR
jgi:nicotinate phosphoribosyltransferase